MEHTHQDTTLRTESGNMAIHLEKLPLFHFDGNGFGSTGEGERSDLFTANAHNTTLKRPESIRFSR
jgi:hypothetical protein